LHKKNEKKKKKIENIRKSQQENEEKIKNEYRRMQNRILKTIISYKDEDLLNFKNRVIPGVLKKQAEYSNKTNQNEEDNKY